LETHRYPNNFPRFSRKPLFTIAYDGLLLTHASFINGPSRAEFGLTF
jgi:hypothetical protein